MLKGLFNKEFLKFGKAEPAKVRVQPAGPDLDDLLYEEKWEEARTLLEQRLKQRKNDHHARLKLAEVLMQLGRGAEAIEQYKQLVVAYHRDGFNDKAMATLNRALRLAPGHPDLQSMFYKLKQAKSLDQTRGVAVEALRAAFQQGPLGMSSGNAGIQAESLWVHLARTEFIHSLPEEQMRRLFAVLEMETLPEGEALVERGEQRHELFLVVDGELAVLDPNAIVLRTLGAGSIVGEVALLEQRAWQARYQAVGETTVLRLTRLGLERTLIGNPDPRELVAVLRRQGNDREIAELLQRTHSAT